MTTTSSDTTTIAYVGCILDCPQAREIERIGLQALADEEDKCHECDCVLHDGVPIQCIEHVDGEERTLCNDCWEEVEEQARADGWRINDEDEDFPRECEECHDSFTPSWVSNRYDAVCNDCVCEHGKTQVTMDETAYRYSVLTFFKQNQ